MEFVGNSSVKERKSRKVTKEHLKHISREFSITLTHDARKDERWARDFQENAFISGEENSSKGYSLALEVEKVKSNALKMKLKGGETVLAWVRT